MPAKSENQAVAARIALAVKLGKLPQSKLTGASRQMYESMSLEQLTEFTKTTHGMKG